VAVATGIIGNLAYDLLKKAFKQLSEPLPAFDVASDHGRHEIVLRAVAEQCRLYRLAVDLSELRVLGVVPYSGGSMALVDASGSQLEAVVTVPQTRLPLRPGCLQWRGTGYQ